MNQQDTNQPLSLKHVVHENDRLYPDPLIGVHDLLSNNLQYSDLNTEKHFDQNKINTKDMNDLNQPSKERKSTFLEPKNDNYENKINNIKQNEQLLPSDKSNTLKPLSSRKQKNATESHRVRSLIDKINRLKLTKHEILMIILNILMVLTLLIVYKCLKKPSADVMAAVEEILVMKRGDPFGGPGGENLLDDAETASLTFNDTITRVTASKSVDVAGESLLLSLTFRYSNGRIGNEYGGIGRRGRWEDLNPLELTAGEHINHITIYEGLRNITNPWRAGKLTHIIVGIYLKTDRNQQILFGSTNGIQKEESLENYFLAYIQGKAVGHIDSLRFTWYKYCLKNSSIIKEIN